MCWKCWNFAFSDTGWFYLPQRGDICGRVQGIVVCELCEKEEECPIVLQVINIDSEVLLENLVEVLSLTVSFRVICGQEVELNAEVLCKGLPKVGDEGHATIRDDIGWGTMFHHNPGNDEVSEAFGCKCHDGRDVLRAICSMR
jgi:hypothetical protein